MMILLRNDAMRSFGSPFPFYRFRTSKIYSKRLEMKTGIFALQLVP